MSTCVPGNENLDSGVLVRAWSELEWRKGEDGEVGQPHLILVQRNRERLSTGREEDGTGMERMLRRFNSFKRLVSQSEPGPTASQ